MAIHGHSRKKQIIQATKAWRLKKESLSLQQKKDMKQQEVIDNIKRVAKETLPPKSSLFLYGSRARGDAHEGSDWDLLILLDKPELEARDYDAAYPFHQLGWELGEDMSPTLYTKKQWASWTYLPYYKNVERDKIVIV